MSLSFTHVLNSNFQQRKFVKYPQLNYFLDGNTPTILYPAGKMARFAAKKLRDLGVKIIGFGDSNKQLWGAILDGIPIISPSDIREKHREAAILVATSMYDSEITEMLTSLGCKLIYPMPFLNYCMPEVFVSREYHGALHAVTDEANHEAINRAYALMADEESRRIFRLKLEYLVTLEKSLLEDICTCFPLYFDSNILSISHDEVFVDGGAFIGDTLEDFLRISSGMFRAYYAFEPDPINFTTLQDFATRDTLRIHAIPAAGLTDKTGDIQFIKTGSFGTRTAVVGDPAGEATAVVAIDEYFSNRDTPTFIKMDIEGSERAALTGAQRIIRKYAPRLAISVYHYPGDLWGLPLLIHELNPSYRLMLRHYTREIADTVCYAVPAGE